MRITSTYVVDYRSVSVVQLPVKGMYGVEMILPGGCTSTATSSCCSCAAIIKN